jgi:glucosamine-6-phosphate deaminase
MRTSSGTTTGEPSCAPTDPAEAPEARPGLRVLALPSVEAVARHAAVALLRACQGSARPLGLATGRTMAPIYSAFSALVRTLPNAQQERLRLAWRSFNLDEYVGLGPEHPQSFAAEMRERLADPLGLAHGQVRLPNGLASDPEREACRYGEALRQAGGVGLQLLGLGLNGHVGFNEPPCGPDSRARCVRLRQSTRRANAEAFGGDPQQVPERAITLGLAEILQAEQILLVVTGAAKAAVVRRLLGHEPSAELPASWLHGHPSACLLVDAAALNG